MVSDLFSEQGKSSLLRLLLAGTALAVLLPACSAVLSAQQATGPYAPTPPVWDGEPVDSSPSRGLNPNMAKMERQRMIALNAERQKNLVADSNRLVKLASELNAEINNTHQAELTPEQLRMIAQIEKLAKSVKDKMSNAVSGAPSISPSPLQVPFGLP